MAAFYRRPSVFVYDIATTRFTNITLCENRFWRERNQHNGCIYGCPVKISYNIDPDMILFVLEMNNTTNKIVGIGVIQPVSCEGYRKSGGQDKSNSMAMTKTMRRVPIYGDNNYNRFVYSSKYRIDIEADFIPLSLYRKILILERMVFYGKGHCKRGQGIQLMPVWLRDYEFDVCDDLVNVFRIKYDRQ